MKLGSILAGALALGLSIASAMAQTGTGSGPMTIAKGGTNATTASAARTSLGVAIGSNVEAWDADLDCLAANSTAGVLARTGAGTCAARTLTAPAAGFTITNPAGTAGDPTFVLANDLAALEGLGSTGFAARTGTDAWAQRSLAAPAAGFTITNPAGIAGNPTFVLANDLAALEGLAANGFAVRTATDTWAQRTITGTANAICVTNGDGVSGNPTLDICSGFLSTAHSWAGVQTFAGPIFTGVTDNQGTLKLSAFVTSTQITAAQNNYTATDGSNTCTTKLTLRISSDASRNVTGLSCAQAEGDVRIIHNVGAQDIVLKNADAGSTAANQFLFGGDVTLLANYSITVRYDGVASRWRAITTASAGGGGGGTVTSATIAAGAGIAVSGTCTITTSGTCTITTRAPTVQVLTSGTGATYTTGSGASYIRVRGCGGGGGSGTTAAGAGGTTSFSASTMSATGGSAGTGTSGTGVLGGVGTNGQYNYTGNAGQATFTQAAGAFAPGMRGGASPLFGGANSGGAGAANSGAGAGNNSFSGAGSNGSTGAAGGCFERIIAAPSATYTYTIGAGGTAGTSGFAGGTGVIVVEEF